MNQVLLLKKESFQRRLLLPFYFIIWFEKDYLTFVNIDKNLNICSSYTNKPIFQQKLAKTRGSNLY